MGCIGCQKGEEESSPTWVIVLLGNIIRGIGEASIGPLGMSFIDDYALPENSAFYIGEKMIVCVFYLKQKYMCPSCHSVHFFLFCRLPAHTRSDRANFRLHTWISVC